ncbi:hypothetical protein ACHAWX_005379 [Stephanocyclus meneghinianus]
MKEQILILDPPTLKRVIRCCDDLGFFSNCKCHNDTCSVSMDGSLDKANINGKYSATKGLQVLKENLCCKVDKAYKESESRLRSTTLLQMYATTKLSEPLLDKPQSALRWCTLVVGFELCTSCAKTHDEGCIDIAKQESVGYIAERKDDTPSSRAKSTTALVVYSVSISVLIIWSFFGIYQGMHGG